MQEHRRYGWYAIGGAMIAAGMAWLAAWGVAVGSAKPPCSLHFLVPALYVAMGVAGAGLLVVVAVMYDWPGRLHGLYPGNAGPPLKVVAGKPHYHDWNYAASVAALPVLITNRTRETVVLPGGIRGEVQAPGAMAWQISLSEDDRAMFDYEAGSQRRSSHHQPALVDGPAIPGRSSVEAWYVIQIGRHPEGNRPHITVRFKDADNNKYEAAWNVPNPPRKRLLGVLPMRHGSV